MILFGSLNFFYEMAIPQFLLMRRQKFRPYFFARLFIVIALSAALYFVPNYYIGLFGISYLLVFALLLIVGMFFFRVHFFDVLFYTVAAFAVQHMVRDILFIVYDVIGGFVEMRRPLPPTLLTHGTKSSRMKTARSSSARPRSSSTCPSSSGPR